MRTDVLARRFFFVSIVMMAFTYGVVATHYDLFPVPLMKDARAAAQQLLEESGTVLPWYYQPSSRVERVTTRVPGSAMPGLRLVSGLGANEQTVASVIDSEGKTVHEWQIDWFKIWPDPSHLTDEQKPKSNAGLVHGIALASNGDLIFNFEELGMVRLDACGQVAWKLPYRTHHSIHLDDEGHIWASGVITHQQARTSLPNHVPPWDGFTIVEVSPAGQILREFDVSELLVDNGLRGLLHLSNISNRNTKVTGDTLHLNDVETFPASMAPGVFSPGDVMISLRNINAILVFDPESRRVKYQNIGTVLRQHDPDFVDGSTISVFDNNNLAVWRPGETTPLAGGHHSRIVRISAADGRAETVYTGSDGEPFFTDIMGAHQRLPNGNMLIVESIAGRVFEIDGSGRIVWEYVNLVRDGLVAVVDDAMWLPVEFDRDFFTRAASACATPDS